MNWLSDVFTNVSKFVSETFVTSEWFRAGISLIGLLFVAVIGISLIMGYDKLQRSISNSRFYKRWKIKQLKKEVSLLSKTLFQGEYENAIHLILSKACSYLSIGDYGYIAHGLKKTTADQFERMKLGILLEYIANSKDYRRIKTLEALLFERRRDLMVFNTAIADWEVSDSAYSWTILKIFEKDSKVTNFECTTKLTEFSKLLKENPSMRPNDVVRHFSS